MEVKMLVVKGNDIEEKSIDITDGLCMVFCLSNGTTVKVDLYDDDDDQGRLGIRTERFLTIKPKASNSIIIIPEE